MPPAMPPATRQESRSADTVGGVVSHSRHYSHLLTAHVAPELYRTVKRQEEEPYLSFVIARSHSSLLPPSPLLLSPLAAVGLPASHPVPP